MTKESNTPPLTTSTSADDVVLGVDGEDKSATNNALHPSESHTSLIVVDTPMCPLGGVMTEDVVQIDGGSVELVGIVEVSKEAPPSSADAAEKGVQGPPTKMTWRHWFLLIQMVLLTLSVMYVEMCLVPALPLISKQYPSNASWVAWVLAAYNVVGGIWTPIAGSLSDTFGVKTMAIGSLILYLAGQVGCALSRNIWMLIAFRGVQGFGMALFVLCFTAIRKIFPPKVVPVALGAISSMFSFGMSVGMVGGAFTITKLTDAGSRWEYVFFVTLPIVAFLILTFSFTLPNVKAAGNAKKRRIDFVGCILLIIGLVLFLSAITFSESLEHGWTNPLVLSFIIIGPVVLVLFVIWESFVKDPLINMKFFLRRNQSLANFTAFGVGFGLFSIFQVLPYVFSVRLGVTDQLKISLLLLPFGLPQIIAGPVAAVLGRKVGFSGTLMTGIAMITLAFGLYIPFHNTTAQCIVLNLLGGTFMGFVMVSMMNVVAEATVPSEFGSASGTNTLLRIVGGAVGPVLISMVMNQNKDVHRIPITSTTTPIVDDGNSTNITSSYSSSSSSSGGNSTIVEQLYTIVEVPSDTGFRNAFIFATCVMAATLLLTMLMKNNGTLFKRCSKEKEKVADSSSDKKEVKEEETKTDCAVGTTKAAMTPDQTSASEPVDVIVEEAVSPSSIVSDQTSENKPSSPPSNQHTTTTI